ncbi:MAG: hypothetical protein ACE15D_16370 [Candidatus Eisenbacteria bacterium]
MSEDISALAVGFDGPFGSVWPIRPIPWAPQPGTEPASPFHPESRRPIRLTLHTESFTNLNLWEAEALSALTDLAGLEDVEILGTSPCEFPQIEVASERLGDSYPVIVNYPDGSSLRTGIEVEDDAVRLPFREVSIVLAHGAVDNDIFVTAHPWILRNASRFFVFRNAAIMPPSAAARVVGLLLRRRHNYHVTSHYLFQGGYHFILMRFILHGLWRYHSACVHAGGEREGAVMSLGSAVLTRAKRALEARDAIAFEYYGGSNGGIARIEYHFDYLMLLLGGALDARARIAYAAYGLRAPEGRAQRNFRNGEYRRALAGAGGTALVAVVERYDALMKTVAALRNTIHGSSPLGVRVNGMNSEAFHLEVPESVRPHLEELVKATPRRCWGVSDRIRPMLSPFVFADSAVRETFHLINDVANATEVERLLADDISLAKIKNGPRKGDSLFSETTGRRLTAIGW